MNFSEKLYTLRKARQLSQEELAEVIGVSRQAVQKWESGASQPDTGNFVALSDYFGVSLDELIKGEAAPAPAPAPTAAPHSHRTRWEYKSRRTLWGLPLVHIHLGWGFCRAKGVLAIGNLATGLFALGGLSAGLISLGGLSLGLLALGGVALGGAALGLLAIGGLAVGVVSLGGLSIGVYAVGGGALASRVAIGGAASGHIAVGERARGAFTPTYGPGTSAETVRQLILQEYPRTWPFLVDFLTFFLG